LLPKLIAGRFALRQLTEGMCLFGTRNLLMKSHTVLRKVRADFDSKIGTGHDFVAEISLCKISGQNRDNKKIPNSSE